MTVKELRDFLEGKDESLVVNIEMIPNFKINIMPAPLQVPQIDDKEKVEEVAVESKAE